MRSYRKIFNEVTTTSFSMEQLRDYFISKSLTQVRVEAKSDLVGKKGIVFGLSGTYNVITSYPKYIVLSDVNGTNSIYLQTGFYNVINESTNSITLKLSGSSSFLTIEF